MRWKGYDAAWDTWEPGSSLESAAHKVARFEGTLAAASGGARNSGSSNKRQPQAAVTVAAAAAATKNGSPFFAGEPEADLQAGPWTSLLAAYRPHASADPEDQPAAGEESSAKPSPYISLVIMCAYETGRKESNIKAYIGPTPINRQEETLGKAGIERVLRYADQVYHRGANGQGPRASPATPLHH